LRIAACAFRSFFNLKRAKADQCNRVTGFQDRFDGFGQSFQRPACVGFGQVGVAGDGIDEFGFVHIMFLWAVIKSDTEFKELMIVDFVEINEDLYTIGLC
jgi:hypothetical protein